MFFVQTREKLTHGLLTFFEKYAKIMYFRYFLKNLFANFRKFAGVLGGSPPEPTPHPQGRPQKVFPPKKSWLRPWLPCRRSFFVLIIFQTSCVSYIKGITYFLLICYSWTQPSGHNGLVRAHARSEGGAV